MINMKMDNNIPWTLLRRILEKADDRDSVKKMRKSALSRFNQIGMSFLKEVADKAVILMNHDKRSTLFPEDIDTALTILLGDITKWKTF